MITGKFIVRYMQPGREVHSVQKQGMISNRLVKLTTASKKEQKEIIDEVNDLVLHLYNRHKENQQKLDEIRGVISR